SPAGTLEALRCESARVASAYRPSVQAAVRLLDEHERLTAELARRSTEVRASQQRLLDAAVGEQLRLERLLERGALRLVDRLAATLRQCADTGAAATVELAARCCHEVGATRDDLHRLLDGSHPRVLVEQGLGAALAALTDRAAVPVRVSAPEIALTPALE